MVIFNSYVSLPEGILSLPTFQTASGSGEKRAKPPKPPKPPKPVSAAHANRRKKIANASSHASFKYM